MKCHANAFVKACAIISALILVAAQAESATYYVNAARPNDAGAGTNWVTAKKSIKTAVALAIDGDTVIVTNGVYGSGTTVTPESGGTLNNRVVITYDITVRSVNGPDVTIIEGSGTNFYGTTSAVRCVYMSKGILSGFTLRGGATFTNGIGVSGVNFGGGGVYVGLSGTIVSNCVIQNCRADGGGGSHGGDLYNCTLTGNTAKGGGGSINSMLNNCTLSGNLA